MKIYGCYIFRLDGICLFEEAFYPMPESALITGMMSAMQAFIKEISGSYANKLSAGGFVFHIERIGKFSISLITSDDDPPNKFLTQIRNSFMQEYGEHITNFMGKTDVFRNFTPRLREILGVKEQEMRIEPTKQLNSFALISISKDLQEIARYLVMNKTVTAKQLSEKIDDTEFHLEEKLEQLLEMGFIGRYFEEKVSTYYI